MATITPTKTKGTHEIPPTTGPTGRIHRPPAQEARNKITKKVRKADQAVLGLLLLFAEESLGAASAYNTSTSANETTRAITGG